MDKFRSWFYRTMQGRYGGDQLSRFLSWAALVLIFISIFIRSNLLSLVITGILVWNLYRTFSRNIFKRQEENRKYLEYKDRIRGFFSGGLRSVKDPAHAYFKCPACGQKVRVPKGKGHIEITCPKCRATFIKNT